MKVRILFPLLPAILCAGCGPHGPAVAPVKGKVVLDGRPLAVGIVNTLPSAGRGAHGEIQADGSFQLHTFAKNDGALVGLHKVSVAAYDGSGGKTPESPYGKLLVPKRYLNPETSELKIDVQTSGNDEVVLDLTSKDPDKK